MSEDSSFLSAIEAEEDKTTFKPKRTRQSSAKFKITDTRKNLATLVTTANNAVKNFVPKYAKYVLEDVEIKALADALAAEIEASPKLQKLAAGASKVGPHMQLIQVAGMIFLPRYMQYMADTKGAPVQEPPHETVTDWPIQNGDHPPAVSAVDIAPGGSPLLWQEN